MEKEPKDSQSLHDINMLKIEEIEPLISFTNDDIHSLKADEFVKFNEVQAPEQFIKLAEQENKNRKNKAVITGWQEQQKIDKWMRIIYAIIFLAVVISQLVVINIIVFKIGMKKLEFDQWVINIFFVSVFGEITGMMYIIVKYFFLPIGKEMIGLMKDV